MKCTDDNCNGDITLVEYGAICDTCHTKHAVYPYQKLIDRLDALDEDLKIATAKAIETAELCKEYETTILIYRQELRTALSQTGIKSNPGVDDEWIIDQVKALLKGGEQ